MWYHLNLVPDHPVVAVALVLVQDLQAAHHLDQDHHQAHLVLLTLQDHLGPVAH